ncbi:unnamed protein product [Dovyalis caffra]|uniref:Uncharacterized protein n=1 Tax=Dovyalis caffra TaxID=77055 RepID=A0AAV1QPB3_9ROSI|nr:unnamed protein product [Dovyalis caffra]
MNLFGINYKNFTIRLADAGVQKDDCFSIPQHTLKVNEFYTDGIYSPVEVGSQLAFLTCANPIQSAVNILDTSSCKSESTGFHNSTFDITSPISHDTEGYSYVIVHVEMLTVLDIPDLCRTSGGEFFNQLFSDMRG